VQRFEAQGDDKTKVTFTMEYELKFDVIGGSSAKQSTNLRREAEVV
jgi:hypothetical protein